MYRGSILTGKLGKEKTRKERKEKEKEK